MKCRVWLLGILIGVASCGGESPDSMFDTAQFEEKQNNMIHAKQLYHEIIRSYPESDHAEMAKRRLEEIQDTTP